MYNNLYDSAVRRGVTNPEVIAQLGASQTSLETGYGRSMAGNNAFGIKGVGTAGTTEAATQEFVNGQMINTRQGFRKYNTVEESADDYIDFLQKNPRYKDVLAASNIQDAIAAQGKTGYATDPDYAKKLQWISNKYGGEMPTQMASAVQQPNTQVPVTPVAPGFDLKNAPPTIPVPEQRTTGDAINQMGTQLAMAKDEAQGGGGATIINNNNTGGGGGGGMQQTHQAPMNIRNEENSLMRMQNGAAAYGLT
jgi:hypothetical protein